MCCRAAGVKRHVMKTCEGSDINCLRTRAARRRVKIALAPDAAPPPARDLRVPQQSILRPDMLCASIIIIPAAITSAPDFDYALFAWHVSAERCVHHPAHQTGSATDHDWPIESHQFSAPPSKFQRVKTVACSCGLPRLDFPVLLRRPHALVLYTLMPALILPHTDTARIPYTTNLSLISPSAVLLL